MRRRAVLGALVGLSLAPAAALPGSLAGCTSAPTLPLPRPVVSVGAPRTAERATIAGTATP